MREGKNEALFDKLERKLSRASHTISVLNIAELVFGFVFLYELLVLPSPKGDTYEIIILLAVSLILAFLMKNPISIIFTGIILFVNNVSYANRVKKLEEGF